MSFETWLAETRPTLRRKDLRDLRCGNASTWLAVAYIQAVRGPQSYSTITREMTRKRQRKYGRVDWPPLDNGLARGLYTISDLEAWACSGT